MLPEDALTPDDVLSTFHGCAWLLNWFWWLWRKPVVR